MESLLAGGWPWGEGVQVAAADGLHEVLDAWFYQAVSCPLHSHVRL